MNCDSCFSYVLQGEKFEPWVWKSPSPLDQFELELDGSIRSFLAKHRVPGAISYDASERVQFRLFGEWSHNPGETFISVPLVSRAKLVGAINFHHAPRVYDQDEVRFLSTLGSMVGAEIGISRLEAEKAGLYEQLETRKSVERGKGILQRELGLTEEQAYLTLQRQSRQRRRSMKEIAQAIIIGDEVRRSSVPIDCAEESYSSHEGIHGRQTDRTPNASTA